MIIVLLLALGVYFLKNNIDKNKKYDEIEDIFLNYIDAWFCEVMTIYVNSDLELTKTTQNRCIDIEDTVTRKIKKSEYDELIVMLRKNKAYSLPSIINSIDVLDGYFFDLTIIGSKDIHRISGWNSDYESERFKRIVDYIKNLANVVDE